MKALWSKLAAKYDALVQRERWLVAIALLLTFTWFLKIRPMLEEAESADLRAELAMRGRGEGLSLFQAPSQFLYLDAPGHYDWKPHTDGSQLGKPLHTCATGNQDALAVVRSQPLWRPRLHRPTE